MYCIMFKNRGELAVTVFCNPVTCPLRMKTVTPTLKNPLVCRLQTVGGQRWFHSDNKSQTFLGWSLIWGVSLLTVTLLKHLAISYQGQQRTLHRTSCTRRERVAVSASSYQIPLTDGNTSQKVQTRHSSWFNKKATPQWERTTELPIHSIQKCSLITPSRVGCLKREVYKHSLRTLSWVTWKCAIVSSGHARCHRAKEHRGLTGVTDKKFTHGLFISMTDTVWWKQTSTKKFQSKLLLVFFYGEQPSMKSISSDAMEGCFHEARLKLAHSLGC